MPEGRYNVTRDTKKPLYSLAPTIHVPFIEDEIRKVARRPAGLGFDMRVAFLREGDTWTIVVGDNQTRTMTTDQLPEEVRENLATVLSLYPHDPNTWYTMSYEPEARRCLNGEDPYIDSMTYVSAMIPPALANDERWELVRDLNAGWRVSANLFTVIMNSNTLRKLRGEPDDTGEKS